MCLKNIELLNYVFFASFLLIVNTYNNNIFFYENFSMSPEYRSSIQAPATNPSLPPPPVPPRFPTEGYTGYNAGYNTGYNVGYSPYRSYGPNYLNSGYGGIGSYRNYNGYNYPGNQMLYHDIPMHNNQGLFGYGNFVNRYVINKKTLHIYLMIIIITFNSNFNNRNIRILIIERTSLNTHTHTHKSKRMFVC